MRERAWICRDVHRNRLVCIGDITKMGVIHKKTSSDNLGESGEDDFKEYELVGDISDKLANGEKVMAKLEGMTSGHLMTRTVVTKVWR